MSLLNHQSKVTPKDFFLYVAMMIALYVSAGSLLKLLFDIINVSFPDALNDYYYDPYSAGMRLAIASLVIVFPIYLWISRYLAKQMNQDDNRRDLWIRKWLIYLTLFVAGVIVIGDLVVLINTFLNGEITIRFILKVLAVLLVAGGVFGGYGYVVRTTKPKEKVTNSFLTVTTIVVLLSIVGGFVIVGSPVTARKIRFDSERVSDLQNIQWQIVNYWQNKNILPESLTDLEDPLLGFTVPTDPVTGEDYAYNLTGDLSFELCADFALSSDVVPGRTMDIIRPSIVKEGPYIENADSWQHEAGQTCFTRTIDPDFYDNR